MIDNPMGQAAVAYHLAQLHLEAEDRRIARALAVAERNGNVAEPSRRRSSRALVAGFLLRLAGGVTRRSGSSPARGQDPTGPVPRRAAPTSGP